MTIENTAGVIQKWDCKITGNCMITGIVYFLFKLHADFGSQQHYFPYAVVMLSFLVGCRQL